MRARYVRCNANDSGGDHFDNLWGDVRQCSNEHGREVNHKGGWADKLLTFSALLTRVTFITTLL